MTTGRHHRGRRGVPAAVIGVVVLIMALAAGTASASPARGVACAPVRLTGEGVATSATTTTAKIYLGSRQVATTTGTFTQTPGGFAGPVVFTPTRHRGGTLVANTVGAYGPDAASFTAAGPVTGTGDLSGATGYLRFAGPLRPDGSFSEVITGTLCADLSRW